MRVNLYVVYDRIAEESGPVYEAKNDGVAVRKYLQMLEKSAVRLSDYQLLCVGSIDHESNKLTAFDSPSIIAIEDSASVAIEAEVR